MAYRNNRRRRRSSRNSRYGQNSRYNQEYRSGSSRSGSGSSSRSGSGSSSRSGSGSSSRSGYSDDGSRSGYSDSGSRSGYSDSGSRSGYSDSGSRSGYSDSGSRSGYSGGSSRSSSGGSSRSGSGSSSRSNYSRSGSSGRRPTKSQMRRRRRLIRRLIIWIVILAIIIIAAVIIVRVAVPRVQARRTVRQEEAAAEVEGEINGGVLGDEEVEEEVDPEQQALDEAELLAAMYDYDGAISTLEDSGYYDTNSQMQSAVTSYQEEKAACVAWEPENVTHVFYHTLIVDPSKAFDGDEMEGGYNQYMCTIDEFNKINQEMYDRGYVMVSMHDMCTVNDDGTVDPKTIYLPEGKTPYVLSQDDVSYYHYMTDDGFATKLIVDENGDVKNEYVEDDGTVSVGNYDLVPLIDEFVEEHPDACYHGHKGTIALTGYEGVLGYRTDEVYRTREEDRLTSTQRKFFEENPDFDDDAWQNEVDQATEVADAMKEEGWEFASHTWGHIDPLAKGYNAFVQDTDRWIDNVEPIVGYTDIIIFAFGADITEGVPQYSEDNEFYRYLKDVAGFNIFCLVDSSQYFVQFNGTSMRMGRRDIDGYRMYYYPDTSNDLYDVDDVWDDSRPTPVPEI